MFKARSQGFAQNNNKAPDESGAVPMASPIKDRGAGQPVIHFTIWDPSFFETAIYLKAFSNETEGIPNSNFSHVRIEASPWSE